MIRQERADSVVPEFWNVDTLAARIDASVDHVRTAITNGQLAAVKLAGRWKIDAREAKAWIEAGAPARAGE